MNLTLQRTENLINAFETINDKSNFKALINFRRTVYGFKILIDVMYCELANNTDVICTKEYLTKKVSSLASRATIINFINGSSLAISKTMPKFFFLTKFATVMTCIELFRKDLFLASKKIL